MELIDIPSGMLCAEIAINRIIPALNNSLFLLDIEWLSINTWILDFVEIEVKKSYSGSDSVKTIGGR